MQEASCRSCPGYSSRHLRAPPGGGCPDRSTNIQAQLADQQHLGTLPGGGCGRTKVRGPHEAWPWGGWGSAAMKPPPGAECTRGRSRDPPPPGTAGLQPRQLLRRTGSLPPGGVAGGVPAARPPGYCCTPPRSCRASRGCRGCVPGAGLWSTSRAGGLVARQPCCCFIPPQSCGAAEHQGSVRSGGVRLQANNLPLVSLRTLAATPHMPQPRCTGHPTEPCRAGLP